MVTVMPETSLEEMVAHSFAFDLGILFAALSKHNVAAS
jgi:hypothetical protein